MRVLFLIPLLCSIALAQFNTTGYRDTVLVNGFQGTGTGSTKAMELSQYENMRLSALANDTSAAGYASDSIKFRWGMQFGVPIMNSSGKLDTTWQEKIEIDTFDIKTAVNLVAPTYTIDSLGNFKICKKFIDTTNVTGYAVQSRDILLPPWSPIFRFWYIGLTGNKVSISYVKLMFAITRRISSYVHLQ
jgi:hypothetical protein